jgi:hypothetical protein
VYVTCALVPERALWAVGGPQGLAHGLMAEPCPDPGGQRADDVWADGARRLDDLRLRIRTYLVPAR